MNELWILFVLFAAPPPGIVTGWSSQHESKAACETAAAHAKVQDVMGRSLYTRTVMVTQCERLW